MDNTTAWVQLKLEIQEPYIEALETWLFEQSALSVTYQDAADEPILEPPLGSSPLWKLVKVLVLFEGDTDINLVNNSIENSNFHEHISSTRWEAIEDKDWVRTWMDDYHPMQFGPRIWICPSWQTPPNNDAINIMLDPGLAFGTGTHPTTSLCLSWLDANCQSGIDVTDYGCGSGILAIAALKLGVKSVLAVDYDPQALIATKENVLRNDIALESLNIVLPEDAPQIKSDLMIANILADTLKSLVSEMAYRVKPMGKIILSGILTNQAQSVIDAYSPWFTMNEPEVLSEWVLISGTRNQKS